jgi:hypothetical protein
MAGIDPTNVIVDASLEPVPTTNGSPVVVAREM